MIGTGYPMRACGEAHKPTTPTGMGFLGAEAFLVRGPTEPPQVGGGGGGLAAYTSAGYMGLGVTELLSAHT